MLLAIMVALVPFNYFMSRTPRCGPHEEHNIQSEFNTSLETELPDVVQIFLSYITNGVLLLPVLALTIVYSLYVRRKRRLYLASATALREELVQEKNEKRQILRDYKIRL